MGRGQTGLTVRGLDNLVIMFDDLETGIARYRELGFTVIPGGSHGGVTHVALVAFADRTYLQLMAFERAAPTHRWWDAKQRGGGFIAFCLHTTTLAEDLAALRRAGAPLRDPVRGGRVRPDGYELAWTTAWTEGPFLPETPVLIEDHTPREQRVPIEYHHENGVRGIAAIAVATDDVPWARGWWSALLGQPGAAIERPEHDAAGVRFEVGPHAIELLAPRGPGGPVASLIDRRGPSPYAVTLAGPGGPRQLDERRAGTLMRIA